MPALSEPPLINRIADPATARRVALGLLLYGVLDMVIGAVMLVTTFRGGGTINLVPGFIVYWVAAWLVWKDKRFIWPLMAYLSAFTLGGLIGSLLGFELGVPAKLTGALLRNAPFEIRLYAGGCVLAAAFSGWLLFESARVPWRRPGPRNPWLQPRMCLLLGAILATATTWGVFALLQGKWTEPVVARARSEYGSGYDYLPVSYQFVSRQGQTTYHAKFLAYSATEFRTVSLNWTD